MKKIMVLYVLFLVSDITPSGLLYDEDSPITCTDVRRMVEETGKIYREKLWQAMDIDEQHQPLKDAQLLHEWLYHLGILESIESICDNPHELTDEEKRMGVTQHQVDAERMRFLLRGYKKPFKGLEVDFPHTRKAAYHAGLRLVNGLEKSAAVSLEK